MAPPSPSRRTLLKRGLAVVAAGGLAGCGADSLPFGGDSSEELPHMNWASPAYQYNSGHTGVIDRGATGFSGGAEVYWRYSTGKSPSQERMPSMVPDNLFVPIGSGLTAFEPRQDERLWRREIPVMSSPTNTARRVLVGGFGLYAFDPDSGEQDWHAKPLHQFTAPVEREGVVYATSTPISGGPAGEDDVDGTVWAFDLGVGTEQWNYSVGGEPSMPALGEDAVFVVASEVHAVDPETGDELWTEEIDARGVPTVRDGRVYVGTDRGIAALDAQSGDRLWHEPVDGVVCRSVAATEDAVYATHGDPGGLFGGLVALDAAEGSTRWAQDHDQPGGTPVVVGGHIYTGSEVGARCFDADDGAEVWTVDPAAGSDDAAATEVVSVPLVFSTIAFVVTGTGDVCALGPPGGWPSKVPEI